jgi:hypothetical protein
MYYHRIYFKYIIIIFTFSQIFWTTCITKIEECLYLEMEGVVARLA